MCCNLEVTSDFRQLVCETQVKSLEVELQSVQQQGQEASALLAVMQDVIQSQNMELQQFTEKVLIAPSIDLLCGVLSREPAMVGKAGLHKMR